MRLTRQPLAVGSHGLVGTVAPVAVRGRIIRDARSVVEARTHHTAWIVICLAIPSCDHRKVSYINFVPFPARNAHTCTMSCRCTKPTHVDTPVYFFSNSQFWTTNVLFCSSPFQCCLQAQVALPPTNKHSPSL